MPSWFLIQFKPNSHRIAERNLNRQGVTTFLPMHEKSRRVRGKFQETQAPLFPGYMFVQLDPEQGNWRAINSTYGVSRLVTLEGKPRPLPDALIDGLKQRCDGKGLLLPPQELEPGDQVRIEKGAFADFVATVERIEDDRRVWLLLDFMGQSTRVQSSGDHLSVA